MSVQRGYFVNYDIEELFRCPVCRVRISPPAKTCCRGHMMCQHCFRRLERCPLCRGRLNMKRNHTIERMAELIPFPCVYMEHGCDAAPMPAFARQNHEIFCRHRPLTCMRSNCVWEKVIPNSLDQPGLPSLVVLNHIKQAHSSEVKFVDSNEVVVVTNKLPKMEKYVLSYEEDVFLAAVDLWSPREGPNLRAGITLLDRPTRGAPAYKFTVLVAGEACENMYKGPVVSYMQAWPGPTKISSEDAHRYNLELKLENKYLTPDGLIKLFFAITAVNNDTN